MSDLYVVEGAGAMREGESHTFTVTWTQFSSVSTAGTEVYRNNSSVTSSAVSGSTTTSGNVLTSPLVTIPSGWGGSEIVIEFGVGVTGGQTFKAGHTIEIPEPGQPQ